MIGAAVLNDIGPEIGTAGLARIMGYAGKIPVPRTGTRRLMSPPDQRALLYRHERPRTGRRWRVSLSTKARTAARHQATTNASPRRCHRSIFPSAFPTCGHITMRCAMFPLMILRGENTDLLPADTFERNEAASSGRDRGDRAGAGPSGIVPGPLQRRRGRQVPGGQPTRTRSLPPHPLRDVPGPENGRRPHWQTAAFHLVQSRSAAATDWPSVFCFFCCCFARLLHHEPSGADGSPS